MNLGPTGVKPYRADPMTYLTASERSKMRAAARKPISRNIQLAQSIGDTRAALDAAADPQAVLASQLLRHKGTAPPPTQATDQPPSRAPPPVMPSLPIHAAAPTHQATQGVVIPIYNEGHRRMLQQHQRAMIQQQQLMGQRNVWGSSISE